MKMMWVRPNISNSEEYALVQAREMSIQPDKVVDTLRMSTSCSVNIPDIHILDEQIVNLLMQPEQQNQNWIMKLEHIGSCNDFFNSDVHPYFSLLIDQIFEQKDLVYIRTMVIELDYFMSIMTLIIYLFWRLIKNNQEATIINEIVKAVFQLRYICLNNDKQLVQFINALYEGKIPKNRLKPFSFHSDIPDYLDTDDFHIFEIDPTEVANCFTQINEEFYAQLAFYHLINRFGVKDSTPFIKEYFNRVNSFSLFIQWCVLKSSHKIKAIEYFYKMCLQFCENQDEEGLFIVYRLGIERIDLEYLQHRQYISNEQQTLIKTMISDCAQDYSYKYINSEVKKLYPIPSFQQFWTKLKRLEQRALDTFDIVPLQAIRTLLMNLMFIRQSNYARMKNRADEGVCWKLKYFLLKGHQELLEQSLQVEIGDWKQMQLELMRMNV